MKWYPVVNMQDFTQKKVFCYLGKLPVLRGLGKECYGWEGRGYPCNGTGFIASHTCFSNQSRQGSAQCSVLCLLVWWGCCTAVSSEHLPACQNQFSSSTNTTWDSLSFDFFFFFLVLICSLYLPSSLLQPSQMGFGCIYEVISSLWWKKIQGTELQMSSPSSWVGTIFLFSHCEILAKVWKSCRNIHCRANYLNKINYFSHYQQGLGFVGGIRCVQNSAWKLF